MKIIGSLHNKMGARGVIVGDEQTIFRVVGPSDGDGAEGEGADGCAVYGLHILEVVL